MVQDRPGHDKRYAIAATRIVGSQQNPIALWCLFISLSWAAGVFVQFFIFNAKPFLNPPLLKIGYHGLTLVFIYHTVIYPLAGILVE